MGSDLTPDIEGAAREVLARYEVPLATVGLRADYRGITDREDLAGMRESAAAIWFYREGELVDVIELPVETPGLEPTTADRARAMLSEGVAELLELHRDAARGGPVHLTTGKGYVDRVFVLLRRVMPLIAGVIAAGYFIVALAGGEGLASILLALLAFIGTYIAAVPTALVASLLHTALMRWSRHDTIPASAALGAVLGAVFGAGTPWLIPLVEPWPLLPIGGAALAGTAVGALYGALATRHAPLPAPEAEALRLTTPDAPPAIIPAEAPPDDEPDASRHSDA
jgi:hypothetical protein